MAGSGEDYPLSIHLNTERTFRGGEVQCLGLLHYLAGHGHDVLLAAPGTAPLSRKAAEASIRTLDWNPSGEWDFRAVFALRKIMPRDLKVVLHAHTAHAVTHAVMAAKGRKNARVVVTRRVSFPLRSLFSLIKYRAADAIVAVSGEIGSQLIESGIPEAKIQVIHSGFDLGRFKEPPSRDDARDQLCLGRDSIVIGSVGALVEHKGHMVMLKALEGLPQKVKDRLEIVIAGSGPLAGELEAIAAKKGLNLSLPGFLEDPGPLYSALDLFVMPSLSGEGSPGVLKEAAACGVPVVASDVGGSVEILRSEKEALLVSPGDAVSLREAIVRLLEDSAYSVKLAGNAGERVLIFSMDTMAGEYEKLYRSLFGQESSGLSVHPQ